MVEIKSFSVLPPKPNNCQMCAVDHATDQPHDHGSLFYQMKFNQEHGRFPTWEDAMAHCSEEVRTQWGSLLK